MVRRLFQSTAGRRGGRGPGWGRQAAELRKSSARGRSAPRRRSRPASSRTHRSPSPAAAASPASRRRRRHRGRLDHQVRVGQLVFGVPSALTPSIPAAPGRAGGSSRAISPRRRRGARNRYSRPGERAVRIGRRRFGFSLAGDGVEQHLRAVLARPVDIGRRHAGEVGGEVEREGARDGERPRLRPLAGAEIEPRLDRGRDVQRLIAEALDIAPPSSPAPCRPSRRSASGRGSVRRSSSAGRGRP